MAVWAGLIDRDAGFRSPTSSLHSRAQSAVIGVGYFDDLEPIDSDEVARIAGVHRQVGCDCSRSDHRVVGPRGCCAAAAPQRRRDAAERSRGRSVEGKRIEVCFCGLEMGLACDTVVVGRGHERADGQLRQGDCGDECCVGQSIDCRDPSEKDQRACVENAGLVHNDASITESRSRRSSSGSTRGRWARRRISSAMGSAPERRGRSSATCLPRRVTVTRSPRATRSTTSPPWLRSSRIDTSAMSLNVSPVIH